MTEPVTNWEQKTFEDWQKSMFSTHCYLMRGANKIYAGIITKPNDNNIQGYVITFDNMSIEDVRSHIKFKNLITNKDEELSVWSKETLGKCRKLCEDRYKIDVGLGYQVKGQPGYRGR